MAKYRELKGVTIQTRDTDPTINAGTWSSQSGMNEGRKALSGFGTYTAAIAATGNDPSTVNSVESWDGSSWTEIAEVNTAKFYRGNNGTQAAGLLIGGAPATTDTEEWNGASWTETADYPATMSQIIQLGTQTAAFAVGGATAPGPYTNATNTYNGASFTSSTAINTARAAGIGSGSTTAAVVAGGTTGSASNTTELWNGSSWTEVNELNTARDLLAGSGSSSTNSLAFGGLSTALTSTESWNGTSWTEVNDLGTGRRELGGSTNGSNTQALAFSGCTSPGAVQTATEQWTFPSGPHLTEGDIFLSGGTTLKGFAKIGGVPTGAWSSGGNAPVGRYGATGFGTQTDFLMMMGEPFSPGAEQCTYNGTAWAESVNFPGGNNTTLFAAGSSSTLGFVAGGYVGTAGNQTESYDWNGTAWTDASADLNTGRNAGNMDGASVTSTIYGGGSPPSSPPTAGKDQAETWNGTAWTEVSELNRSRYNMAGGGASDSNAFIAGGYGAPPSPNTNIADTETWDGSSWTEGPNLNTGRSTNSGGGTNTLALVFGGGPTSPGRYAVTELWNGSSWSELADLSIGREYMPSSSNTGTAVKGFASVGLTTLSPAFPTATEEWTADTTLSTITVS